MKKVTFLVGLPASGKTTYVNSIKDENTTVLSSDDIIQDISDRYGVTYDDAFDKLIGFSNMMFDRGIEESIKLEVDNIYIDRTNLTRRGRERLINRFTKAGYECYAVVFSHKDQETMRHRLESREGKTIPHHVIDSMISNFEYPTVDEGFREVSDYISDVY